MRRALTIWSVVFGLFILAFIGTVAALNSTLYSASGFVHGYLDALARHDAAGAMDLAEIELTEAPTDDLLRPELLGELTDITAVSDEPGLGGTRIVTFSYSMNGQEGESQFSVEPAGTVLGLFTSWRFAESPLSTVALTVLNDPRFDVNDVSFLTYADPTVAAEYLVFTPGAYVFDHETDYLAASPESKTITRIGGRTQVVVDVQANDTFVAQVQEELNSYFDEECVPQTVLQPTGCPFGKHVGNRIVTDPVWSMSQYPEVTIVPGLDQGTWLMPQSSGAAHLVVDVQSLFDGTVSTLDEDVPFTVSYLITFEPDGGLLIEVKE